MKYPTQRQYRIFVLTFMHFNNFFISSTVGNWIMMARISTYMDNNLKEAGLSDPAMQALYIIFHPQHLAYMLLFNKWKVTIGVQHGKVFTKDELVDQLEHTNIAKWDLETQKVFEKGTEEYETIWQGGHAVMTEGHIDDRIAAILTKADLMEPYPGLAALRTIITAFHTLILGAEGLVSGKKGAHGSAAGNVETGRKVNGKAMHQIFGDLLKAYSGNDTELERYVDVEEIQKKAEKNPLVSAILKASIDKVASRTLLATDHFTITNDGTVALKFYLIKNLGDIPGIFVTVPAGQTLTFLASALGNITFRYIMCENDSLTTNGHYSFLFDE